MIRVEVDQESLRYVQNRLGLMQRKAPQVISAALNDTARSARVKLATKARETYTVKSANFKGEMKIRRATYSRLTAEIKSQGKPLKLASFRTSAGSRTSGAKANVVKGRGLQAIVSRITGNKAFKGSGSLNGQIYQRRGKSRYPLKVFSSNSIPVMIGNEEKVYGIVEPKIKSDLQKNMERQIKRLVG